jgi:hypothetical protein
VQVGESIPDAYPIRRLTFQLGELRLDKENLQLGLANEYEVWSEGAPG